MWQELLTRISPILLIFLPIATGVSMGIASRGKFSRATENRFAKFCEDAALKLFLPFFVIESISKSSPSYDIALAFIIGFLLPLFALVGMWLYKTAFSGKKYFTPNYDDLRFLASTYGGGNRGTALVILVFATSTHFNDYLKWFSLVDLGNFSCLLLIISALLSRQYGAPSSNSRGYLPRILDNYAVVTALIVILYFLSQRYWPSVDHLLSETAQYRKVIFSFLVFLAITLRFEHGVLKHFFADLLAFFAARLFAALCVGALLLFLPNALPVYLSVVILLLMPPSSLLPSMIGQVNAPGNTLKYVNGFTGAANVLYFLLIALGIVFAISQAVQ